MQFQCVADCPPSLVVAALAFVLVGAMGFGLARWRRWTPLLWIPLSLVAVAPFLSNGWGIDDRGRVALGCAWILTLVGAVRSRKRARGREAA